MPNVSRMLVAVALVLGPGLAPGRPWASEPEKAASSEAGQYMEMSVVALPVVVGGKLVNYAFVHSRVNLTPRADPVRMREREPFIRDGVVRAAHRAPLNAPSDAHGVDAARFRAVLAAQAVAQLGAQNIRSVELTSQQPLRYVRRLPG